MLAGSQPPILSKAMLRRPMPTSRSPGGERGAGKARQVSYLLAQVPGSHPRCCSNDLSVAEIVYTLARIRRFVEGTDIDTKLVSDELPGTPDPIAGVTAFA